MRAIMTGQVGMNKKRYVEDVAQYARDEGESIQTFHVMSPDQLVRLASTPKRGSTTKRGQHNEIPFECVNFSINSLKSQYHTRCNDQNLAEEVAKAVRQGRQYPRIKTAMSELMIEICQLRETYLERVKAQL